MTVWVGYTQTSVEYERAPRCGRDEDTRSGTLLRFSIDAISSPRGALRDGYPGRLRVSFFAFLAIPYVVADLLPASTCRA